MATKKPITKKKEITKNIILLVDAPLGGAIKTIESIKKSTKDFRFVVLYSKKYVGRERHELLDLCHAIVPCNFNDQDSIIEALSSHRNEIKSVHCRAEALIPRFQKVIPHVPYTRTPTSESLDWSVNKLKMRRRFRAYNKKITPKFTYVHDTTKKTIDRIVKQIGFPLIIKPTDLAQSLLISNVYHREELEKVLKDTFKKIKKVYKDSNRTVEPGILVEEFIEGSLYSVDGYISSRGTVTFCPMVQVKTGKEIGFDDFFGYQQMTPTTLAKTSIEAAEGVAKEGVKALGLRSVAFHAELIKTDSAWKVVEIGARIGGFRAELYEYSYGINHRANSVFVTIPKKLEVPKRTKGHSAVLKIFAKKEGVIKSINGTKKVQELKSVKQFTQRIKTGDKAVFANKGGKSVMNIILFNKDRSKLLADIRRIEKLVEIKV